MQFTFPVLKPLMLNINSICLTLLSRGEKCLWVMIFIAETGEKDGMEGVL